MPDFPNRNERSAGRGIFPPLPVPSWDGTRKLRSRAGRDRTRGGPLSLFSFKIKDKDKVFLYL